MAQKAKWTGMHTFSLLGIIAAILVIGLQFSKYGRFSAWLATMVLLTIFSTIAGHGVTGLWRGLLIDERNKMSLSRMQMALWTIVILAGLLTAALSNVAEGFSGPLDIKIPGEIWLLMGISTTSMIGSPLVKSAKKTKSAETTEFDHTLQLMAAQGISSEKVTHIGKIIANRDMEDARWSDMFKGEETANAAHLDLAKIQMFYFTLILVIIYVVTMGDIFLTTTTKIDALPVLNDGMISLLGISHAGYLANKAVPHSEGA